MISRNEFSCLQQLLINDSYAHQNLTVPVFEEGEPFKHLILTGRNGSGKTTVLRALNAILIGRISKASFSNATSPHDNLEAFFIKVDNFLFRKHLGKRAATIVAFFEATRKVNGQEVTTVAREDVLEAQLLQPHANQSPI